MKRSSFFAFVIWLAISFALAGISIGTERGIHVKRINDLSHESGKLGEYKALIIGINDYKGAKIPDLETPINDAKAIAKVLKEKYGFKVKLLLDREATREAIYRGLRRLAASTKPNDSVLIYFAGHGDLDRTYNDGWWIPSDAIGGNPLTYLDNGQVQKAMRSMKARHVLLISDSCYSGTLFGKARSLPSVIDDKYYLNLYAEKSRWGMTSGNKTPVSDQGTGGHSVFAYQLIKELEKSDKPFVSAQEIYTRIAPVIANNSEQTPLCRPILHTGDQGGEFVFVASIKKEPAPTIPKIQQGTMDREIVFWQSIEDSQDPALFEAYLKAFPKGLFAPIAKRKIEALKPRKVMASVQSEVLKSKIFVDFEPSNARVRILNIKPKFLQGMELAPGRYHVEVSSSGYDTKAMWTRLQAGKDETLRFSLKKSTVPQKRVPQKPKMIVQAPKRNYVQFGGHTWEILGPNVWKVRNGVLYGSSYGTGQEPVFTIVMDGRGSFRDGYIEIDFQLIEGWCWVGFSLRTKIFQGGAMKRYRQETSDVESMATNFSPTKQTFNSFIGKRGNWYLANPSRKKWQKNIHIDKKKNHFKVEVRGQIYKIWVNGYILDEFKDDYHFKGVPMIALAGTSKVMFSNFKMVKYK